MLSGGGFCEEGRGVVAPVGKRYIRLLQLICIVGAIVIAYPLLEREPPLLNNEKAITDAPGKDQARLELNQSSDHSPDQIPAIAIVSGQEKATGEVPESK